MRVVWFNDFRINLKKKKKSKKKWFFQPKNKINKKNSCKKIGLITFEKCKKLLGEWLGLSDDEGRDKLR